MRTYLVTAGVFLLLGPQARAEEVCSIGLLDSTKSLEADRIISEICVPGQILSYGAVGLDVSPAISRYCDYSKHVQMRQNGFSCMFAGVRGSKTIVVK